MFNGEIFNHSELRYDLEKKGVDFISDHSDSEVLYLESHTLELNI